MADKTPEAITAVNPFKGQGAPPSAADTAQRLPPATRDPAPRRDTVQISDVARKAADGNLHFNYNPDTKTLQAQIVDANGKTLSELPPDAQIKARQQLAEFLDMHTKSGDE